ncbi:hypothetical protein ACJA88_010550 [Fusarium oxysporum]
MPPASDTPGSDQPDNSDGRRQPWKSFFSGEESGSEAESPDDQLVIGYPRPPDGTCAKYIFEHEKPYEILSQAPPGIERSNFQLRPGQPETIHDLRGLRTIFNLDQNGFQVVSNTLKTSCFDEATIKKDYLPSIEALLKSVEPDIDVHIFDWTLRSSGLPDPKPGTIVNLNDPMLCLKPVQDVHVGEYGTFESSHREWN